VESWHSPGVFHWTDCNWETASLATTPILKKLTPELGRNDAFIMAANADIDAVVAGAVLNRFYNFGQVCTSTKRILVDVNRADEFVRRAKNAVKKSIIGDCLKKVNIGPLDNPR
jgi:acyl-CoA reductase-like NAD-dependent aldehyde dehydrogenase